MLNFSQFLAEGENKYWKDARKQGHFVALTASLKHKKHLDTLNADHEKRGATHASKFKDSHGNLIVSHDTEYNGYNKGTYRVIHPGSYVSIVQKTHSGKGVIVHQPELSTMANAWLRNPVDKKPGK